MTQRGPRSLRQALQSLDKSKITAELRPYYKKWERGDGHVGRPPHDPVGMLLALLIALINEYSFPDLTNFLHKHPEWLLFLDLEKVPCETAWSKFIKRLPTACLEGVLATLVKELVAKDFLKLRVIAGDGSFVPAAPHDKEAAWGYARRKGDKRPLPYGKYVPSEEDGTILGYGYRLHVLVDADAEVPVVVKITRANVNDVTMFPALFQAGKKTFGWDKVGWFTGDKGYDATDVRAPFNTYSTQVAIPARGTPDDLKAGGFRGVAARVYKKRTAVERFFSKFKSVFALCRRGVVGAERVGKWLVFGCIAVLLAAWVNGELGLRRGSLRAFRRAAD